jgi:hypothetical protein
MKKSKVYTFLKMFVFGLFVLSFIVFAVNAINDPSNTEKSGDSFLVMLGFLGLFLSLEGGLKMLYTDWFMFAPDKPYGWDEKLFYPIKFVLCGVLWIISKIFMYTTVVSMFTMGPICLSYVFIGQNVAGYLSTLIMLNLLLLIVGLANKYEVRKKML